MRSLLIRQLNSILRDRDSQQDGFTLLEGIVVVGILIVLAAIAIPSYQGFISTAGDAKTGYEASATANSTNAEAALTNASTEAGL